MKRKDFIRSVGRILILGGITTSAGYLFMNKKISASCSVAPRCENCGKFRKCELPQAEQTRLDQGGKQSSGLSPKG